jgi:hypothetical protein
VFLKDELLEDLQILWNSMKDHPKLFEYTSEREFEKIYEQIKGKLKDGMTADDFLNLAYPLLGRIGCGHSSLMPPMSYISNPSGTTVPLDVRLGEDQVIILATYPDGIIPLGSQLLSINDRSITEIATKLMDFLSVDGLKNLSYKRFAAAKLFGLLYPKLFTPCDDYKIKFQVPNSTKIKETTLDAYETKAIWLPLMMENTREPYQIRYKKDINAAIIKIKTFYFGGENNDYYSFLENAFEHIIENEIQNVILDLRGNSGGDPVAAARLFSYIAPKPVKYFADVYSKEYEKLADPISLASNHFDGNLFTIIDGGGISTAGHIVSLIKYHKIGKIVGSELGSTFTCNDGCVRISLKHTENLVTVARITFIAAVEGMKADQGVMPDYPVIFSIEDIMKNIDSEMELVVQLIEESAGT